MTYTDEKALAANKKRISTLLDGLDLMKFETAPVEREAAEWVKALDAKCRAGSVKDCVELGSALVDGGGDVRMDWDRAGRLFTMGCAKRAKRACRYLGMLAYKDGAADHAKVALVLDAACAKRDADACSELAAMTATGRGVPADAPAAAALRARACKLGSPEDCAPK